MQDVPEAGPDAVAERPWHQVYEMMAPHVVQVTTPMGSGTGFLLSRSPDSPLVTVATAAHVVNHAHYWEQPIRLLHSTSGDTLLLRPGDRAVFLDEMHDTAAVFFNAMSVPLPREPMALAPEDRFLRVGLEIGWLGFPAMAQSNLCFFSGRVSTVRVAEHLYLVDGVAINGVSGGPALFNKGGEPVVMGVVSAYIPNQATGLALPGLSVIRDVSHLQSVTKQLESLDQAKEQETPPVEPPKVAPPENEGA